MREILFKAKRTDNGEWVIGSYLPKTHEIIVNEWDCSDIYIEDETDGYCYFYYKIDIETVCQYTGLSDKNRNKIWENDIVKVNDRLYVVHYYEPFAMYMLKAIKKGGGLNGMTARLFESEVVGNVFDNLELVGE